MERLGSLDAVFLAIEEPASPMNIGSIGIFEGPAPAIEAVREFVGAKLDAIPRCRQRVREAPLHLVRPVWIDDVRFDVSDHVHHVVVPSDRPDAIEEFVARVMEQPIDRRRAPWAMWLVEGLTNERWAIVSTMHHCMVDGVAGTDLLAAMMDSTADVEHGAVEHSPVGPWTPNPEPSAIELLRFSATATASSAWAHACGAMGALRRAGRTWSAARHALAGAKRLWLQPSRRDSPLTGPIGPGRRWARTRVSLEDVASVRNAFGGTVNDVVLTAVARGFRELLLSRSVTVEDRTVMALVPVSMRGADGHGHLDNRVAVSHAMLPVGIDDPRSTYLAVRSHLDDVKRSHETDASSILVHVGDFTPHAIASVVARAVVRVQQNLETIASNVPGPRSPLYLCGHRMLEAYPFAPIAGRIRIAVAIWSYCGMLHIGVTGDRDGAGDLDVLIRGVDRGFAQLVDRAASGARSAPT